MTRTAKWLMAGAYLGVAIALFLWGLAYWGPRPTDANPAPLPGEHGSAEPITEIGIGTAPQDDFALFFQDLKAASKTVAWLSCGDKGRGTGFLINETTLVTAGHATCPDTFPTYAQFLFLEGIPLFALGAPVYSKDRSLAWYRLPKEASEAVAAHALRYPIIANMQRIYDGLTACFISPGSVWRGVGTPLIFSFVTYTEYTHDVTYHYMRANDDNETYERSIGIPGAVPGDSGAPVFAYDPEARQTVLIGIMETTMYATRADVLAQALEDIGVSFQRQ